MVAAHPTDERVESLADSVVSALRRVRMALPRTQRNRKTWQPYIDAVATLSKLAAQMNDQAQQHAAQRAETDLLLFAQRDMLLAVREVGRKHGGNVEREIEAVLNRGGA